MISISFTTMIVAISLVWLIIRAGFWINSKRIDVVREAQLILVYICIVVVCRFTFFAFGKVDGKIAPLIFDIYCVFPLRLNFVPFMKLMDYPRLSEAWLNLIGNTTMFIPLGIVWPSVFKKLNTHAKVIVAGVGVSLCIEILQLPFFSRVTDIDDLILNSFGYIIGYGIYLLVKKLSKPKLAGTQK